MNSIEPFAAQFLPNTPFWNRLTPAQQNTVLARLSVRQFHKDQLISSSDSSCMGMVFIRSGSMRVSLISEEGREITLYRLTAGECCVATASCVIAQITFDTTVTAGEESELIIIPSPVVSQLANENIYFRSFLFETETQRYSQAIWVLQELVFKRFDQRLADYLLAEYEKSGHAELKLTQEEIARDVNSAREVVARMLRHFSADGLVEVKRGHITLLDIPGLKEHL